MIYVDTSEKTSKKSTFILVLILGIGLFFIIRTIIDTSQPTEAIGVEQPSTGQDSVQEQPVVNSDFIPGDIKATRNCEVKTGSNGNLVESAQTGKKWILIGPEFSETDKSALVQIKLNSEAEKLLNGKKPSLTYEIIDTKKGGTVKEKEGAKLEYSQGIYVGDLKPAEYTIKINASIPSGATQEVICKFIASYPVYVTWTQDWEGHDVPQQYLNDIDSIANKYGIPVTHFFNPRLYINTAVSKDRRKYLTDWVLKRMKSRDDSSALHLHMYYDMVKAAGIAVKTTPTFGGSYNDGYNVTVSAYSYEEMLSILTWSKKQFKDNGLPEPTIYRSGGWFADITTLMILQDSGFVADSSGRTKYVVLSGGITGPWDLKSTTQPYHPNDFNQNSADAPNMKIWEFPNNGGESWSFTAEQMIDRFKQNYKGGPAKARTTVTFLSHPHWFNVDKPKIEKLFTFVNQYNRNKDQGPVVYINMDKLYKVYAGIK